MTTITALWVVIFTAAYVGVGALVALLVGAVFSQSSDPYTQPYTLSEAKMITAIWPIVVAVILLVSTTFLIEMLCIFVKDAYCHAKQVMVCK